MMHDPFDYRDPAKQQALTDLGRIRACMGEYDEEAIEIELTPAHGHIPIGDAELPHIIDCVNVLGNVHGLALSGTAITDKSALHIARLRGVTFLCLSATAVTDATLPHLLSVSGLKELSLSGTAITDSGVEYLRQLRSLTFLQLLGTQITRMGIFELTVSLPETHIEHDFLYRDS
jgi:hypothetical protein